MHDRLASSILAERLFGKFQPFASTPFEELEAQIAKFIKEDRDRLVALGIVNPEKSI